MLAFFRQHRRARCCHHPNLFTPKWRSEMRNVRYVAMLMVLFLVSACGNNEFDNAYSVMDVGEVGPIPLDD